MRLLLTLLLCFSLQAAYTHKRPLATDPDEVAGSSHTDFVMWVDITDNGLRTTGNGGNVTDAQGDDINFFADEALTTPLSWSPLVYDGTTGRVRTRVKIPSLSGTVATTIWIAYGDSGITTFQSTATAVWSSSYVAVWPTDVDPVSNGTSVPDATSNARNASLVTNNTSTNKSVTGKLYKGIRIDGSGDYLTSPDNTAFTFSNGSGQDLPFSLSGWFYLRSISATAGILSKWTTYKSNNEWIVYTDGSRLRFEMYENSDWLLGRSAPLTSGTHQDQWIYVVCTYSGSETSAGLKIYINGAQVDNTTDGTGAYTGQYNSTSPVVVGAYAGGNNANADFEMIQVANVERSADWVATEYANQNTPGTFYTLGTEESVGGPPAKPDRLRVIVIN